MLIKLGDSGRNVKEIQSLLKQRGFYSGNIDGVFGPITEDSVKRFQLKTGLNVDGIVGNNTFTELLDGIDTDGEGYNPNIVDTDGKLQYLGEYKTTNGLTIERVYLDTDEYVQDYGKIKPKNLFLHHTAGWDNPYNTVHGWNVDKLGRVATQYVIGGLNINGDSKHDGKVIETFPDGYIGWHLGKVGNMNASIYSVGIELNNFGYLNKRGDKYFTYTNREVPCDQVVDLGYEFRGYRYWHKYSDEQIKSLRKLILHIVEIYPLIDITKGLMAKLETTTPLNAFEFDNKAYNASEYGMWSHTSVRKDKFDCFPQPELVNMIKSIKECL